MVVRCLSWLIVVSLLLVGCSSRSVSPVYDDAELPAALKQQAELRASCGLDSYDEFWNESSRLTRQWNYRSAEIVEAYIDESVSLDQYLNTSRTILPYLEGIVVELRSLAACLSNPSLSQSFDRIVDSYAGKLTGYFTLENSVRLGDIDGEQIALEMLKQAQKAGQDALCSELPDVVEKLRDIQPLMPIPDCLG